MNRVRSLLSIASFTVLITAISVTSVSAQQNEEQAPVRIDTIKITPGNDGRIQIQNIQDLIRDQARHRRGGAPEVTEAEQYMQQGNYTRAIAILKPLFDANPDHLAVATSLKRAYKGTKDYEALDGVLKRQLAVAPGDGLLLSELADTYFLTGQNEKAESTLESLLKSAPSDPDRYNLAARAYLNAGDYQKGVSTYHRGRRELGDSLIFAQELGRLYEARREYTSAVIEHFRWLAARPESRSQAERRITNLIKVPEALDQITLALERIVGDYPKNEYAHSLYADLLFESGTIDSAFAEYRRADILSEAAGDNQYKGLKRCLETEQYASARLESKDFLTRYPEHPRRIDAGFILAQAELGLKRPGVAITMLNDLAAQIPLDGERARIQYEIGEIYRNHVRNMDSAQSYFMLIAKTSPRERERTRALTRLGDLAVYFGNLDRADSTYSAALNGHPQPNDREEIAFRLAEVELFRQQYDVCVEKLSGLVQAHPRGLYVNDALQLTLMINEGQDAMNWSLNRYADGAYALRRGQDDKALVLFNEIVTDSANSIADEALFQVAQIHASHTAFDSAVTDYQRLISIFPESHLVPRAWVEIGDIYAGQLSDIDEARRAYQVIITDYKESPLVEEARLRLQKLGLP